MAKWFMAHPGDGLGFRWQKYYEELSMTYRICLSPLWKNFNLSWNWKILNGESHNVPSEERNLRSKRLTSLKCLIYKRQRLILANKHSPRIPPCPQANELTAWALAELPLFTFLVHEYSPLNPSPPAIPSIDSPVASYSMNFPNCNYSAIPK